MNIDEIARKQQEKFEAEALSMGGPEFLLFCRGFYIQTLEGPLLNLRISRREPDWDSYNLGYLSAMHLVWKKL